MNAVLPYLATRSAYADWAPPERELDHAQGAWLYTRDGRRLLDFASGSGSLIFGHGDQGAVQTLAEQMSRYAVYPASEFRSAPVERYLEELIAFVGGGFRRAVLASSGSDAVEAACKLALQYHHARGDGARVHILGRQASYHGNTLTGLGVGGFLRRRAPYERVLGAAPTAAPAFCYRCTLGKRPDSCAVDCAGSVEQAFAAADPGTVAAFVMEPVVGAALGAAVPDPRYYEQVCALCDRYGVLLIADEVMTGFGRTGTALASQHWRVQPDIAIVGKAMSAGYFPLSGVLTTEPVAAALRSVGEYFENGQTHLFSAPGAAIGSYVLQRIRGEGLLERSLRMGQRLRERLAPLLELPVIGDVRGLGLMTGIELVRDRATRAPFAATRGIGRRFARLAMQHGLVVYPSAGGAQTLDGDHVLLLPPLTIDDAELDFAATCLLRAAAQLADQLAGEPPSMDGPVPQVRPVSVRTP